MSLNSRLDFHVTCDCHNCEVVDNLLYLETNININNKHVGLEIQHRITFGNRLFFGQLKSEGLSRRIKIKPYKFLIISLLSLRIEKGEMIKRRRL